MKQKYTTFNLIRYIAPYFIKNKWILLFDLFCAALTTVAEIGLPIILRYITNLGIYNIDLLSIEIVLRLSIVFIIIKVIDVFSTYYMASVGHIMGAKIETDMRSSIYSHLHKLSNNFYDDAKVGQLMSRITNDLFDITEFAHHGPEEYFIGGIKVVVSFIILIRINVPLTLLVYIIIPIMMISSTIFRRKMRMAQLYQRKQVGNLNSAIEDTLSGIRVVKSFANEDIELDKFEKENSKFLDIKRTYYKSMAGFMCVNRIFDGIMYLLILSLGAYMMIKREISAGDMIIYVMYVTTLLSTIRRIIEFTENFQKSITGIERFKEIMDIKSDINDVENAVTVRRFNGVIDFKNVDFKYKNADKNVLTNLNLHIAQGKNLAIVGPSGSGKTTICNLIPRFYEVSSGSIEIDGTDIRNITLSSLRDNIGIVQQEVYLFSGTIKDNISYGKPEANMEEIIEASKLAGAYDFIMGLPDNFDTIVGERGILLSGGQKQRISIARVFLKNPPILILDEATSALDNQSEKIVQESITKLAKGRTTIVIAHRLTTIQEADEIIVMNESGIVERGKHTELIDKKGYYYDLYTKGGVIKV